MNARHRLLCALLLLIGSAMPSLLAASNCPNGCQPFPRPQDQIWLVGTRHLPSIRCGALATSGVHVHRYRATRGWQVADTTTFYASDDPDVLTCVYVHAARVDDELVIPRGLAIYRKLVFGRTAAPPPVRMVIWRWPADKTRRPLKDFRRQAPRADTDACYLGRFLAGIDPDVKVSLIGFSMGPRIITGAMHLLGGGSLHGFALPTAAGKPCVRVRAVLWAPAVHSQWLWPDWPHGKATVPLDQMLVLYNSLDPVLARYAVVERCASPTALGFTGVPSPERLGPAQSRIATADLRCVLGKVHAFDRYIAAPYVIEHTRNWAFWKPVGNARHRGTNQQAAAPPSAR